MRCSDRQPATPRPGYGDSVTGRRIISIELLAHDLAMAYINNRYGPDVSGSLSITTSEDDVTGGAIVSTERLPDTGAKVSTKVPTGEKRLFGMMDKKKWVETDEFQVDAVFNKMIDDYDAAHARFVHLLTVRQPAPRAT